MVRLLTGLDFKRKTIDRRRKCPSSTHLPADPNVNKLEDIIRIVGQPSPMTITVRPTKSLNVPAI